jgi:hypothetical protein
MGDLPQHAAQVRMLHDLLLGSSRWSDLVRINYLTPYILAYAAATALSFVLPVLTALKVVLTAAYLGSVAAGRALLREVGGDERLDWLYVPGFFGFCFQYGLFPFLVAVPVGLVFLRLAWRCAGAPTRSAAWRMFGAGLLLFVCHGLAFYFCAGVAFAITALRRPRGGLGRVMLPYAGFALLAVAVFVNARLHEPVMGGPLTINWEWNHLGGWHRIFAFPDYVVASTPHDLAFFPVVAALLAAPWVLGDRPARDRAALVPFAAMLALWLVVPGEISSTTYLYHRFAVFLLPAYAMTFRTHAAAPRARALAIEAALAVFCCLFLGGVALRELRFARESAAFEKILDAAEPDQRALTYAPDPESPAIHHGWAYNSYALYYQSERGGFVDFNFAALLPEVVRFRAERPSALKATMVPSDWSTLDTSIYRYVFVRHEQPLPDSVLAGGRCRLGLVRREDDWSLYEPRGCR